MRIAEIIVNTSVKSLDKMFHYIIPDNINIEEGMRVEIPFGVGNKKLIGYFVGFVESSPYQDNLKPIIKVIDKSPLINKKGLELARFVRKNYLCSMADAIRLLLPPAVKMAVEKMVVLKDFETNIKLSPSQKVIIDTLKAAGGKSELKKLLLASRVKSVAPLRLLRDKGIVDILEFSVGGEKSKTVKYIILSASVIDACIILETLRIKAKAAARALEMLLEYEKLPLSDLIEYAECSYSSATLLVKYNLAQIEDVDVYRKVVGDNYDKTYAYSPTDQQSIVIITLFESIEKEEYKSFLLHGVTGSGKTEVFMQSVQRCIEKGKNAIVLVPEIALTPQMTERFVGRFGQRIAVLHSGLSLGERYDEWRRIKSGQVNVVVGARSAVFAPFDDIGLIIIDEEHETSYKSESTPRYNAIEVANYRAKQNNCIILKASATPLVDSYYDTSNGHSTLLTLSRRYNNQIMPSVEIVSMAEELLAGNKTVISRRLADEMYKNILNDEQTILFLNRRGYSTFVSCRNCGFVVECPHCSVSMTYHSNGDFLSCHYCGNKIDNYKECPKCGDKHIKYFGCGTQKVEEDIKKIFPGLSIIRMDADTTSHKFSHERILRQFKEENINVLLGTQMVTKGLDFPNITLVGVLAADMVLNLDDFRASEKAFSQLSQVCGRAGRGDKAGRAIIQTYSPNNDTLRLAATQNYEIFYDGEINLRQIFDNPPFSKFINIIISGEHMLKTKQYANVIADDLRERLYKTTLCKSFYGPTEAPLSKLKNRFRFRILLKTINSVEINEILERVYNKHLDNKSKIMLDIDINPNNIL